MTMTFYLKRLPLMALIVLFYSCSKSTSIEGGFVPNNNNGPCVSCSYIPWCDSTGYHYIDTTNTGTNDYNVYLSLISDTTIDNVIYTKTLQAGNIVYHRCNNNNTSLIRDINGIRSTNTILKADLNLGNTWQEVNPGSGTNVITDYRIMGKAVNRDVLGTIYRDVIWVREKVSINSPVFGNIISSETDNYYAKYIGLIESIIRDGQTGNQILHRVLESYQLP
jgi:hypothetical protein